MGGVGDIVCCAGAERRDTRAIPYDPFIPPTGPTIVVNIKLLLCIIYIHNGGFKPLLHRIFHIKPLAYEPFSSGFF
jgi:hypothetical protein